MKLSEKQRIFTRYVGNLLLYAHAQGYELTIGHVWRDKETQARMLAEGLSRTRNSKHLDKLAIDLNLFINDAYITDKELYRDLGEYWEDLDPKNRWGGRFGIKEEDYDTKLGWDPSHFQFS